MNIAMWSGPRNLSTAMMYAFAQRGDCAVWDEPFYAAYLALTGLEHPMRAEILAAGDTDPQAVIARCVAPAERPVFYQKHMTHHMLDEIDETWMRQVTNVFLIRHPARVVASYQAKRENPSLDDLGFRRQYELFEFARALGQTPIVIDSADIRANPKQSLAKLCEALGLAFDEAMLSWPQGGHPADGAWAPHWYGAIHRSTGFAGPEGPLPELDGDLAELEFVGMEFYRELAKLKL